MNIFVRRIILLQLFFIFPYPCMSQELLEPRQWSHLPINKNFIGAAYAYTGGNIDFDPVLKIENGEFQMHTWAAKYIRSFRLFNKTAQIDILQIYQKGKWTGLLDGVPSMVKRSGWFDTNLRFAINLYGSPPLEGKEYAAYRAAIKVETIIGAGLSVQLPTGNYLEDKLINLGTNRFTFRPQIGIVHRRENWSLETTGFVALYTDNNDFFDGHKLEQEPLFVVHSHIIYTFRPGVWAGASAGYDYGGSSRVDGISKNNRNQDIIWAFSVGFPVNRQIVGKISYIKYRTKESTGVDSDTLLVGLSTNW